MSVPNGQALVGSLADWVESKWAKELRIFLSGLVKYKSHRLTITIWATRGQQSFAFSVTLTDIPESH